MNLLLKRLLWLPAVAKTMAGLWVRQIESAREETRGEQDLVVRLWRGGRAATSDGTVGWRSQTMSVEPEKALAQGL